MDLDAWARRAKERELDKLQKEREVISKHMRQLEAERKQITSKINELKEALDR